MKLAPAYCRKCERLITRCICPTPTFNDGELEPARLAGADSRGAPGYAVHIDGTTGEIDAATQAALDKMAALLRKKELIRTGNAGVDSNGVIVDIRKSLKAVRLPPHNGLMSHAVKDSRK